MKNKKHEYKQLIKRIDGKLSKIENRELREQTKDLLEELNNSIHGVYIAAITDQKTGVYNNYFFETMLEMEIDKAKRNKEKFCIFMLDIDYFKKINDTYGHIKADDMLKRLSTILVKNTRKFDILARFGGEEFIILFPGTTLTKSRKIINRIIYSIKNDIFLKGFGLTVSGGLTKFRKTDTSRSIKERVDKGLYQAKKTGRDKFIIIE